VPSRPSRPLLLLDLDNTLIDRDRAWQAGLVEFYEAHGLPLGDLEWVMLLDRRGHAPRGELVDALRERYDGALPIEEFWEFLRWGAANRARVEPGVNEALRAATAAGWTPVVVTNGAVAQQSAKIRNAKLDAVVAGCVISEAVGFRKPEPGIFHAAAAVVDGTLDGAWMVGDTEEADIGGPTRLGLSTAWLPRGRDWPDDLPYRPTLIADDVSSAIQQIISRP
jgi:putative hydrolase of the HAD superfamily